MKLTVTVPFRVLAAAVAASVLVWLALELESKHGWETRTYPVMPGLFRGFSDVPKRANRPGAEARADIQSFFEDAGVTFPAGAYITYNDRLSTLVVRSTSENLDVLEQVIGGANLVPTQVTIEARFLRLTRELANDLVKPEPMLGRASVLKPDTLRRIRDLEARKRITVIAQPKLTTVSGNTAQVKSVEEFRYPTEFCFVPPSDTNAPAPATQPRTLVPGGFETREIGTLLNVTPTLGPDGRTINLTLVPEISTLAEPARKIEVSYPGGKVTVEQPRFRSQQITTTVQMWSGTTILMGVADPVQGEDDRQITLMLLTATVVGIQ
jgi:hypothetical protein